MLAVTCYSCHQVLDVPGALVFGPPDEHDNVKKYHLCVECFNPTAMVTPLMKLRDRGTTPSDILNYMESRIAVWKSSMDELRKWPESRQSPSWANAMQSLQIRVEEYQAIIKIFRLPA
jgi:hypothetical protein